jgi:hypothetical protein
MTPRTQQNLRDAWRGPKTAAAVAKKFHQGSARTVQRFWKAEQDAGRLPSGARPHFRHCTASAVAECDPVVDLGSSIDAAADLVLDREIAHSEAVSAGLVGCAVADGDPLLAALERAHGADLRRHCDDHIFDDRLTEPSAKHCRAQRRYRDRVMTMIDKNPARFKAAFGVSAL